MSVEFNIIRQGQGLSQSRRILAQAVRGGLEGTGKRLQRGVRSRAREFEGREKRNIAYEIKGKGVNQFLFVYGSLVQTFIDELGLPPGTFPPWGEGTLVFRWAQKKRLAQDTPRAEQHNFNVRRRPRRVQHVRQTQNARRVTGATRTVPAVPVPREAGPERSRALRSLKAAKRARARQNETRRMAYLVARAIFERGIRANAPFAKTFEANRAMIERELINAIIRAVNKINRT